MAFLGFFRGISAYDALTSRGSQEQAWAHEFPDELDRLKLWADFWWNLITAY